MLLKEPLYQYQSHGGFATDLNLRKTLSISFQTRGFWEDSTTLQYLVNNRGVGVPVSSSATLKVKFYSVV